MSSGYINDILLGGKTMLDHSGGHIDRHINFVSKLVCGILNVQSSSTMPHQYQLTITNTLEFLKVLYDGQYIHKH